MRIIKCNNKQEMADLAYQTFQEYLTNVVDPVIGLATGSSPIAFYDKLIDEYNKGNFSFKGFRTFNLDEYIGVPKEHEQSYYSTMSKLLFDHIDIDRNLIEIPNGNAPDLSLECERYETLLDQYRIDVQILGIGTNGHIAFNEPGCSLASKVHITELKEQTIKDNARFFDTIEEVPTKAITMGLVNILHAKKIILLVSGSNKAEAVRDMIQGNVTDNLPASILQLHRHVTVIVDADAARLI